MTQTCSVSEINSGYIFMNKRFEKAKKITVKKVCSLQAVGLQLHLEQVNQVSQTSSLRFFFQVWLGNKTLGSKNVHGDLVLISQVITFWEPLFLNNVFLAQSILLLPFFLILKILLLFIHVSNFLELELQTAVSHHVSAGNQTTVF